MEKRLAVNSDSWNGRCSIPPGGTPPLSLYQPDVTPHDFTLASDRYCYSMECDSRTAYDDLIRYDVKGSKRPPNSFSCLFFLLCSSLLNVCVRPVH
ncbi:hypothetical protein AVEN_52964-1 [Araneus ventricosus]|uniref:Uncharacterized protein n=1 Tax=Araneus ventricosus TaxID=182803 RepID=A0A4Y2JKD3_ARAVE|nr:hypothetical protein AVEN_52964-1 [Araneus ventricosus]